MPQMKVRFDTPNGKFTVEVECSNVKQLFEAAGEVCEALQDSACGACNSEAVYPRMRKTPDGKYAYYEMVCVDCGAKLSYGQNKDLIHIFAKRKSEDGNSWLPDGGWAKFQRDSEPGEASGRQKQERTAPAGEDPRLKEMLTAASSNEKTDHVAQALCDEIRALGGGGQRGDEFCEKRWRQATNDRPDNATLIRRLYAVTKEKPAA